MWVAGAGALAFGGPTAPLPAHLPSDAAWRAASEAAVLEVDTPTKGSRSHAACNVTGRAGGGPLCGAQRGRRPAAARAWAAGGAPAGPDNPPNRPRMLTPVPHLDTTSTSATAKRLVLLLGAIGLSSTMSPIDATPASSCAWYRLVTRMRLAYSGWGGKRSTSTRTVLGIAVDTTRPLTDWAADTSRAPRLGRAVAGARSRADALAGERGWVGRGPAARRRCVCGRQHWRAWCGVWLANLEPALSHATHAYTP